MLTKLSCYLGPVFSLRHQARHLSRRSVEAERVGFFARFLPPAASQSATLPSSRMSGYSFRPPLSRQENPHADEHKRAGCSYDLEHGQRFVRLIRLWNQRQCDGRRSGDESDSGNQLGDTPSSGHADYIWAGRFALQIDHGGKQIQIWDEISDDAQADENVVGTLDAGTRLSKKNENHAEKELCEQRDPGTFPARMQRSEDRRQQAINAGHKWQTGDGGEIRSCRSNVAESDEKCRQRKHAAEPYAGRGFRDGLYQPLQTADFTGRQRQQHANRSQDVADGNRHSTKQKREGNSAARVLDFFSHKGSGLAPAEGEGQHRPENDVVEAHAGSHRVQSE